MNIFRTPYVNLKNAVSKLILSKLHGEIFYFSQIQKKKKYLININY